MVDVLEHYGAPVGSELSVDGRPSLIFGRTRGIGVYLDGISLADEVYETSDVNDLVEALEEAVGPIEGVMLSSWRGPTETALYFFASDVSRLRELLTEALRPFPLAHSCRVVELPTTR